MRRRRGQEEQEDLHIWGAVVEKPSSIGLEKPLSVQSLMSCYGELQVNAKSRADDGGLAFQGEI